MILWLHNDFCPKFGFILLYGRGIGNDIKVAYWAKYSVVEGGVVGLTAGGCNEGI